MQHKILVFPHEEKPHLCALIDLSQPHYWYNVPLSQVNQILIEFYTRSTQKISELPETIQVKFTYSNNYKETP